MVKKILILDDDRVRHYCFDEKFAIDYPDAKIDHVYTANECIEALKRTDKYDLVHLDHDLGDFGPYSDEKEHTGVDVCRWMAGTDGLTEDKRPDMIIVHSWNATGAKRMIDILRDAGFTVFQKLFSP
jgi:CheY-like chemotaxis protein